jgi:CBS domain-containing protein
MKLRDILNVKGKHVQTVCPHATLEEAIQELVSHNVGSLLVCERDLNAGEQLVGIVTERDIVRFWASGKGALANYQVSDIMTTRLIVGSPEDAAETAMSQMTAHRIRHLPILSEGRLVGLVSIGDLVKSRLDELALENHFMKSYIAS